jgi:hypothetical protein
MTKQFSNYSDLITFTRASGGHALRPVSYGDELVTNGTFDSDVSGWSDDSSAGGSIAWNSSGYLNLAATTGTSRASQSIDTTAGNIYFISLEVISLNGSTGPVLYFDGVQQGSALTVGTTTFVYVATGSSVAVSIRNFTTGTTVYIDNVSVKEVFFDQPDGTLTLFEHPDDIPRVEYDADGNRLGLLVEESRTNLVTDSQDFSASSWTKTNTATLSLDSIGPDGQANSAVKLIDDSATGTGVVRVFDNVGVSTSTDYTFSVYGKADQLSKMLLFTIGFTTPSNNGYIFDLNDGTYTAYSGTPALTPSVEYVGNGWYRCSISFTTDATDTSGSLAIYAYDTSEAVDLDGTSSILIYGAQFEEGAFPTSYIKSNSGSTTTRSADVASIPVADFGYNQSAGSLVVEAEITHSVTTAQRFIVGTNSGNSRWAYKNGGTGVISIYDGTTVTSSVNALSDGQFSKISSFADRKNMGVTVDGEAVVSSVTTGNMTALPTEFRIGHSPFVGGELNGHIKSIKYYPRRLTNAQLQDLTS